MDKKWLWWAGLVAAGLGMAGVRQCVGCDFTDLAQLGHCAAELADLRLVGILLAGYSLAVLWPPGRLAKLISQSVPDDPPRENGSVVQDKPALPAVRETEPGEPHAH